jgi:hypothetical protein
MADIDYINKPEYLVCGATLTYNLTEVTGGERSISHLEELKLLPAPCSLLLEQLDFHQKFTTQTKANKAARLIAVLNGLIMLLKLQLLVMLHS